MAIRTESDDLIDEASNKIVELTRQAEHIRTTLLKAVDQDTWGADEWTEAYVEDLHVVIEELASVQRWKRLVLGVRVR